MNPTLEQITQAPTTSLQGVALLVARLFPLIILTPLFGGNATPRRFRFGVAIALSLVLLPLAMPPAQTALAVGTFAALLVKELLVGLTIALIVLVIFEAFAAFGYLVDSARGATFANILDPLSQQHQSVLSVFFLQLSVALFLASGGYRVLIETLASSLALIPLFSPPSRSLHAPDASENVIRITAGLLVISLRLAAPVLVVMLILDLALGLINRIAPQFQAYFLGLAVKGPLGLLVVFIGLGLSFDAVLSDTIDQARLWLSRFAGGGGGVGVGGP